ncbi:MAG: hypothetical protein CME63_16255 [Halobacteriovoraceae bacterium]|nr:hypothetical protein [Halobacteriovoraceae bacterium]|tara:strand:- start:57819 stop:58142 length:324 start_codon:yes stop_codon:yes gene_type:complete
MKTLIATALLAVISLTSFAKPVSQEVITEAFEAVKAYYPEANSIQYSHSSSEDQEVFFYVSYTTNLSDMYFDEGEPVFLPITRSCEQEVVYLVDLKKVLYTQEHICF